MRKRASALALTFGAPIVLAAVFLAAHLALAALTDRIVTPSQWIWVALIVWVVSQALTLVLVWRAKRDSEIARRD